ncbi:MAG: diguanylate cyclase, partial [Rhizobiaceae bacterium]
TIAEKVAERVRAEIAGTPYLDGKKGDSIDVTVSVGVSELHRIGDTVEELMKRTDLALYEAKSGGRNRVVAKAA